MEFWRTTSHAWYKRTVRTVTKRKVNIFDRFFGAFNCGVRDLELTCKWMRFLFVRLVDRMTLTTAFCICFNTVFPILLIEF